MSTVEVLVALAILVDLTDVVPEESRCLNPNCRRKNCDILLHRLDPRD